MNLHSKAIIMDYLWSHSHFLHSCLSQCETLYRQEMGFACLTLLFNCLENTTRSATNDYTSNLYNVFSFLYENDYITKKEHDFLNEGDYCLRKIRNLYAHKNIAAINFVENCEESEELWPLTENDTSLMIYSKISDIVFNLMIKIVSKGYTDDVKVRFRQSLDEFIDACNLRYKILSSKELLIMKGYPDDYIPDNLDITEDTRIRLIECAPDINMWYDIFLALNENI